MKKYIKKFLVCLIAYAMIFDGTTAFALTVLRTNNSVNNQNNVISDSQKEQLLNETNEKKNSNETITKEKSITSEIEQPTSTQSNNSNEVVEDVTKRTQFSRTIKNEDGKYRVEYSMFPLFKQVNGVFEEINNNFINNKTDGLYQSEVFLDNQVKLQLNNVNKSKLGILFETKQTNKHQFNDNIVSINQDQRNNNYELKADDYDINTKITFKQNKNNYLFLLEDIENYKKTENIIELNNNEYTILPVYYQDKIIETDIVERDGKKYLALNTVNIKENNFVLDLKIAINPLQKVRTRLTANLGLSDYLYANTNTDLPNSSIINDDLNVGSNQADNNTTYLRSYVSFARPTIESTYGNILKASLDYQIQQEVSTQSTSVNMSNTYKNPNQITWNNRNNGLSWSKIGNGIKKNATTYSFDVLTYLNHLRSGGNRRTLEFRGYEGSDYRRLDLKTKNVKLIIDYEYDFSSNTKLTTSLNVHSKGRGKVHSITFNGVSAPTKSVRYVLKTYDKKGNQINASTKSTPNFTKTAAKKTMHPVYITNYLKSTQKYADKVINYDSGYLKRSRFKTDTYYDYEVTSNGETLISQGFMFYKVKPGDTLKTIARYYGIKQATIKRDNNFKGSKVKTGEILFVRGMSSYKKAKGKNSASKNRKVNRKKMKFCASCGTKYKYVADPVNPNTGNFFLVNADVELNDSQNFTFYRNYNSIDMQNSGLFGYTWTSDIEQRISFEDSTANFDTDEMEDIDDDLETNPDEVEKDVGDQLLFIKGDGNLITFKKDGNNYVAEEFDKYEVFSYKAECYAIRDLDKRVTSYFDEEGTLAYLVDEHNRKINIEYNADNTLITRITTENREINFEYNEENFVSKIKLANGSEIKYEYEEGHLTKVINAVGAQETYHYNEEGLMDYYLDKNGVKLGENKYDEEGKVVEQTTETGQTYKFNYEDGKTTVTDPEGNVKDYAYDDLYRLEEETGADGSGVKKYFDNRDNLVKEISGNGDIITYEYDVKNNLLKQTNPDQTTIENEYNENDYVTKTTYNNNQFETFKYDTNNNVIEHRDIYGNITTSVYNAESELIKETDPKGVITTYTYELGKVKVENIDNRQITTNYYDELGNVIKTIDQDNKVELFDYDLKGNLIKEVNKLGGITSYQYDKEDNVIKEIDARGLVTLSKYDEKNNKVEENVGGEITTNEYDSNNNLIKETDPNGNITTNKYDSKNNLIETINPQGNSEKNIYDSNDNVVETIDERGNSTKYQYNKANVVIAEENVHGKTIKSEYDQDGNLIKEINEHGNSITTGFENNLPVLETNENGLKKQIEYDEYNREIKTIEESANGNIITEFTYDKYDNIIKETNNKGSIITREYDVNDNIILENNNGIITKTKFDALGNEIESVEANGLVTISEYNKAGDLIRKNENNRITNYEYDELGNQVKEIDPLGNISTAKYDGDLLIEEENAIGIKTTYEYDQYDQLLEKRVNGLVKEKHEYNEYGDIIFTEDNETTTSYTYNKYGQVASETNNGYKKTYEYDDYENIIQEKDQSGLIVTNTYDKYNNLIKSINGNKAVTTYQYDKENQETVVTNADGTKQYTYYDALGNEIKTIDDKGIKTEFKYDIFGDVIEERTNNSKITKYKYDKMGEVSEENDNGAITKTEYDLYGNEIKEVSPNGNITLTEYDKNDNEIKVTNPDQTNTQLKYDKLNRLILEQNEAGAKKVYQYDSFDNQIKMIDELGYVYENKYDSKDRLIKEVLPTKKAKTYVYDKNNNLIKETDFNGNVTNTTYDFKNREASLTSPNGLVTKNSYDNEDNIIRTTDSNGRTTQSIYNNKEQLIEEKTNGRSITKYQYNKYNQKIAQINANGIKTKYSYDTFDRLTKEQTNSRFLTYSYDKFDNTIYENEANLRKTKTTYDKEQNVLSINENGLVTERNTYDKMNRILESTNAQGVKTKNTYDKVGNITKVVEEYYENKTKKSRIVEVNQYDALARVVSKENAIKARETYQYDALGNIIKKTDALNHQENYRYDGNNNIIQYQDQGKKVVNYAYDKMNNVTTKTILDQKSTNSYDKYGNVIKMIDDYGYTTNYKYDKFDNKILEQRADKSKLSYKYDKENNLLETKSKSTKITKKYNAYDEVTSATNKNGTLKYTYNGLGDVTSYTDPKQNKVSYKYDKYLNVKEMKYAKKKINYTYNKKNQLSYVKENNKLVEVYKYDGLGRLSERLKANKIKTKYNFDDKDRLIKQTSTKGTKTIESLAYAYNKNDSLISEVKVDSKGKQTKQMKYNESDELVESKLTNKKGQVTTAYAYDVNGNKTVAKNGKIKERYEYNKRGQLTSITSNKGIKKYAYDKRGNVSKIKQNDGMLETLKYDDFNNLISLKNNKLEHTYKYDANNNRIQSSTKDLKKYQQAQSETNQLQEFTELENKLDYLADSFNCQMDLNASGDYSGLGYSSGTNKSLQGLEITNYQLNGSIDEAQVLAQSSNNKANNQVHVYGLGRIKSDDTYYLNKINDSVSKTTNQKGTVTRSYEYSDYGTELSGYKNGFAYNGEIVDASGLQYLRARYLDTNSGNFIQKDSYQGEQDDIISQNQYIYVLNNPYKYIDSTGNKAVVWAGLKSAMAKLANKTRTVKPTKPYYNWNNIGKKKSSNYNGKQMTGSWHAAMEYFYNNFFAKRQYKTTYVNSVGKVVHSFSRTPQTKADKVKYVLQRQKREAAILKKYGANYLAGYRRGYSFSGPFLEAIITSFIPIPGAAYIKGGKLMFNTKRGSKAVAVAKNGRRTVKSTKVAKAALGKNQAWYVKIKETAIKGIKSCKQRIVDRFKGKVKKPSKTPTKKRAQSKRKSVSRRKQLVARNHNYKKRTEKSIPRNLRKQLRISKDGYTISNLKTGTAIHKWWWKHKNNPAKGLYKEFVTKYGRKRIDFLDVNNHIIYELKPNNPRAIKDGKKQAQAYIKLLEQEFKGTTGKWKVVIKTY